MELRVDPWNPEYGASVELDEELGPPVGLDLEAETDGDWAPVNPGPAEELPCCAFVDGVRRIEARLFAKEADVEAPGLAGSFAVGAAWSTRPPRVDRVDVGRVLVVGGGLTPGELEAPIGDGRLVFSPRSVP